MATPNITLTGNLKDIFGAAATDGHVLFQLCNYGSYLPRVLGTAVLAPTAPDKVAVDGSGHFSKTLWGNDQISPAGTYYTIQILDGEGNIIQTGAYEFSGAPATYDLSALTPIGPTPTPPSPPTPVPSALLYTHVTFDAAAVFDAQETEGIITFKMDLTADLTAPTLVNLIPGQFINFTFQQDGVGGHTVTWPANVFGGGIVDNRANKRTSQLFYVDGDGNAYALGIQTVN
jgi:hypothetical protein